jgi:hypothetical protein
MAIIVVVSIKTRSTYCSMVLITMFGKTSWMSCHELGTQLGHTNEGQVFSTKGFKWSSMGSSPLWCRVLNPQKTIIKQGFFFYKVFQCWKNQHGTCIGFFLFLTLLVNIRMFGNIKTLCFIQLQSCIMHWSNMMIHVNCAMDLVVHNHAFSTLGIFWT